MLASGNCCRSARIRGVLHTRSPILSRRMTRIFTSFPSRSGPTQGCAAGSLRGVDQILGAILVFMASHHLGVGCLGNVTCLVEMRKPVLNLADAVIHIVVVGPFTRDIEIIGCMPASVGQEEPTASRHAITSLGQPPAEFPTMIAGGAEAQVDAGALNDPNLFRFANPRGMLDVMPDTQGIQARPQCFEKCLTGRMFLVTYAIHVAQEGNIVFVKIRIAHFGQRAAMEVEVANPDRIRTVDFDGGEFPGRLHRVRGINIEPIQQAEPRNPPLADAHMPRRVPVQTDERNTRPLQCLPETPGPPWLPNGLVKIDDHQFELRRISRQGPGILDHFVAQIPEPLFQRLETLAVIDDDFFPAHARTPLFFMTAHSLPTRVAKLSALNCAKCARASAGSILNACTCKRVNSASKIAPPSLRGSSKNRPVTSAATVSVNGRALTARIGVPHTWASITFRPSASFSGRPVSR